MTTSFYLEHYLDSLTSLPGELRRNFTLMHDMDDKNQNILRDVDAASDEYLRKVRMNKVSDISVCNNTVIGG